MYQYLFTFVILFFISAKLSAQVPENNAVLNYIHIPFQWEPIAFATHYEINIKQADGNKKVTTAKTTTNAYLCTSGITWNTSYEWSVKAFQGNKILKNYTSQFFKTNINEVALQSKATFFIPTNIKEQTNKDLLFIENIGAAIDRDGKIIWMLKKDESISVDEKSFRSMQMTQDGNISFLTLSGCYEVDLKGNILWQAPTLIPNNGNTTEEYHHHFAKTSIGSYMCASYYYETQKHFMDATKDVKVRYNTMLEFDKYGSNIWRWNEKDHVDPKVVFEGAQGDEDTWAGTHMNGFVEDMKNSRYFISCRNSSQVYAIDYNTGSIGKTWSGKPAKFNKPIFSFFDQHGPSMTANGELIIYNNNIQPTATTPIYPTIQIVNPDSKEPKKELVWEYTAAWAKKPEGIQTKEGFAKELDNGNILVCVGSTNRIFEVTRNKKIVWDCSFEKTKNTEVEKLVPFSNYRCYNTKYLHPNLFGIAVVKNTKTNRNIIVIECKGNADSYDVQLKTVDEVSELKRIVATPKKSSSKTIEIDLDSLIKTKQAFYVIVTSKTNTTKQQKVLVTL